MDKTPYVELERAVAQARGLVPQGSRWRHYKGAEYTVSDVVLLEATNEVAVMYAPVAHPTVSWVRPLANWQQTVETKDGGPAPRFSRVDRG